MNKSRLLPKYADLLGVSIVKTQRNYFKMYRVTIFILLLHLLYVQNLIIHMLFMAYYDFLNQKAPKCHV